MDDQDEKRDEFPAGFYVSGFNLSRWHLYHHAIAGPLLTGCVTETEARELARRLVAPAVDAAVEKATKGLRAELGQARQRIEELQKGQARVFPPGYSFDPYQGEGFGCLRHEGLPFKVVDDVDEAQALRVAEALAGVAKQPVYHAPLPCDAPAKESLVYLDVQETAAERLDLLWDAGEVIGWLKADLAEATAHAEKAEARAEAAEDMLDHQRDMRAITDLALENWQRRTLAVERECRKVASAWCDIASGIIPDIRRIEALARGEGITQVSLPSPTPRGFPVVGAHDGPPEYYTGIYIEETGYRGPLAYCLAFAFRGDDSAETLEEAQALAREYQAITATTDGWGE